jgi:hypothetical protein
MYLLYTDANIKNIIVYIENQLINAVIFVKSMYYSLNLTKNNL